MLERNLYEMAIEKLTDGIFYALTLSITGGFITTRHMHRILVDCKQYCTVGAKRFLRWDMFLARIARDHV